VPAGRSVHVALGTPTDASPSDDLLLVKAQYVVSYNRFRNDPNWVAWRLTASDLGTVGRTQRTFSPDPQLPDGVYRVHHRDYAGGGYDHGHLCPSAERTATFDDNAATFLTTNIVPQRHAINAGAWESLERWSVEKAREGWDLFIVAGGRWDAACATDAAPGGNLPSERCPTVGRSPDPARRVAIPTSTWKVIVLVPQGRGLDAVTPGSPVVAVEMPNEAGPGGDWQRFAVTVDELEARTGYDFLNLVPVAVQQRIEAAAPPR
jgi:endonuclease G